MQHAYEFFGSEHCHRLFQDFQKSQNLVSNQQAHFPLLQYIAIDVSALPNRF